MVRGSMYKFRIDRFPIAYPNYYLTKVLTLEETQDTLYRISCNELNIHLTGGTRENTLNRLYNILAKLPISIPIYPEDKGTYYKEVKISDRVNLEQEVRNKDIKKHECDECIKSATHKCNICGEYLCDSCKCPCKIK